MPAKRRRRFQGLYYHSSPPKVLPMNGQIANENGRKRRDNDVKLSTIRIWMHEKDIGKLTRILWAGQGQRLRQQASTNPKVKRFLTAVPYVMNSVKDVHQAVMDNSLETLQAKLEPPVPPALVTCRDANGLNLIHKAAGLGHATILEYLITTWPDGVHEIDITGKTPLHWAASAKNNMRCYTLLTQAGCDEEAVDYKMKTPSFYRHKPHDIERAFLTYVPEAPRVSPDVATDWEALSDDSGDGKKLDIKIPEMNGFGRDSIAESNENTSEAEMAEGTSGQEDEEMSKEDDGGPPESEALIENDEENEADTPEVENTEEHEEEEPKQTEQEEEEPPGTTEDQEEPEEDAPDEENKDDDDETKDGDDEEEPQDDKQQTLTLNDTTTTTTSQAEEPETELEHEHESKEEAELEPESTTEAELEPESKTEAELEPESKPEAELEPESKINDENENSKEEHNNSDHEEESKDNDDTESEHKEEDINGNGELKEAVNENKEMGEKEEDEDEKTKGEEEEEKGDTPSKTVGETLEVIKEEFKDNMKYLANSVKNVFTSNEEETTEKETDDGKKEEENGNEEKTDETKKEEENGNEDSNSITDENEKDDIKYFENNEEIKMETNEPLTQDIEHNKTEEEHSLNEVDKENNHETPKETEKLNETETINAAQDTTNENIKDHAQNLINSPSKETHLNDSAKSENNKTAEDENNNHTKELESVKETTDEDYDKINKSLQEFLEDKDTSLEETQQGIGDKLGEIADNVKESLKEKQLEIGDKLEELSDNVKDNVKDMADKVKNIFTSSSEDDKDKLENELTDVVVLTESPTKHLKKTKKQSESSDETADEDEATQAVETKNDSKADIKSNDDDPDGETSADNDLETTDNDEREAEGSPTSSLAIEGFVQGEAEDNTVQSQTAAYVDDDEETRLQSVIASGDMEQLAQIVLNGDGQKLLDVEATEPEIQAFLKNVPNYMTKIRRVHEASRSGSLLNLQQALDRRKFAIAKDEISPNGATPLHVAVLFGHSDIVRYLSARFPETTTIKDVDDRTALHYAAVINDNGHFYNVLLQLGANPKEVDKMGHTPEEYFTNESLKDTLSYGQLLKNFGAEELEGQLLSDQGQIENHSYEENPLFKTEQGKYLADNLADPLIKALTQVAQKRPNDPLEYLTNYLQTFVTSRNTNGKTKIQAAIHSGSSQTNSTALVNSKSSTPPMAQIMSQRQTSQMNGHAKYDNTDEIEEDSLPQIDAYDYDDDDGNDSDAALSKKLDERDEHGQSMLHFASARSHRKGGLIHLIEEAKADITYRDELYRTARDVALQANQLGNAKEIDRYLISLLIVGDLKPFEHFALSGYDHIIDVVDDNEMPVIEIAESKGHMELADYLRTIRPLEELREELHQMIRDNNVDRVMEIANGSNGRWLIKAKNYYGRTALHIAILKESEEIIEHFVNICPEALKIGDNLERTALHYAMGTNIIESISRILIQNGAKRTYKDLKGRQPSYYFMNKADILRLQEEEDENR